MLHAWQDKPTAADLAPNPIDTAIEAGGEFWKAPARDGAAPLQWQTFQPSIALTDGANPDSVDFDRSVKHITFGSGPHTCSGALLARKEMTVFLQEWLTRIPDFEADETRPPRMIGMAANSIYSLWLKWPVG